MSLFRIAGSPTSRASATNLLSTFQDKFEADASMTRTDYNLSPSGDAYDVNGTLFGQLINTCQAAGYSNECMGAFNQLRFNQSLNTNGYVSLTSISIWCAQLIFVFFYRNFFNGPLQFFVLGTCLLPLNSFANFANGSPNPTEATISSFWGTSQSADGSWHYNRNESIPAYWYNRPTSYSLETIVAQIFSDYMIYPAPLGGNTGAPNTFVGLNYPGFVQNGTLKNATPNGVLCLLYNTITFGLPTSLLQTLQLTTAQATFAKSKLGTTFASFGCTN